MDIKNRLDNCTKTSGFHVSCLVETEHRNKYGELISKDTQHNIVVDGGLNFIVGLVASSASTDHANYIGLGISAVTPGQTATELYGASYETALCGLSRATGQISIGVGSIGMYQISKTFTASISNASIGAAGLYTNSTTPGNLFSGVVLSSPPVLQSSDTLQIVWTVQFS